MLTLKTPSEVCAVTQLADMCECPACHGSFVLGGGTFAEVWFHSTERGLHTCTIAFCGLECLLKSANPQGRC